MLRVAYGHKEIKDTHSGVGHKMTLRFLDPYIYPTYIKTALEAIGKGRLRPPLAAAAPKCNRGNFKSLNIKRRHQVQHFWSYYLYFHKPDKPNKGPAIISFVARVIQPQFVRRGSCMYRRTCCTVRSTTLQSMHRRIPMFLHRNHPCNNIHTHEANACYKPSCMKLVRFPRRQPRIRTRVHMLLPTIMSERLIDN